MNTVLKSILAGVLLGAALFIMPFFLVRFFLFIFLIGALFRLFAGGRFRRRWGRGWGYAGMPYAFTDRIRQMSDDEYTQFKNHHGGMGYCRNAGPAQRNENKDNQEATNA